MESNPSDNNEPVGDTGSTSLPDHDSADRKGDVPVPAVLEGGPGGDIAPLPTEASLCPPSSQWTEEEDQESSPHTPTSHSQLEGPLQSRSDLRHTAGSEANDEVQEPLLQGSAEHYEASVPSHENSQLQDDKEDDSPRSVEEHVDSDCESQESKASLGLGTERLHPVAWKPPEEAEGSSTEEGCDDQKNLNGESVHGSPKIGIDRILSPAEEGGSSQAQNMEEPKADSKVMGKVDEANDEEYQAREPERKGETPSETDISLEAVSNSTQEKMNISQEVGPSSTQAKADISLEAVSSSPQEKMNISPEEGSNSTQEKMNISQEVGPSSTQAKADISLEAVSSSPQEKMNISPEEGSSSTQEKVDISLEVSSSSTQEKMDISLEAGSSSTQEKVDISLEAGSCSTQEKVDISLEVGSSSTLEKVGISPEASPSSTQEKMDISLEASPSSTQEKMDISLEADTSSTQEKVRHVQEGTESPASGNHQSLTSCVEKTVDLVSECSESFDCRDTEVRSIPEATTIRSGQEGPGDFYLPPATKQSDETTTDASETDQAYSTSNTDFSDEQSVQDETVADTPKEKLSVPEVEATSPDDETREESSDLVQQCFAGKDSTTLENIDLSLDELGNDEHPKSIHLQNEGSQLHLDGGVEAITPAEKLTEESTKTVAEISSSGEDLVSPSANTGNEFTCGRSTEDAEDQESLLPEGTTDNFREQAGILPDFTKRQSFLDVCDSESSHSLVETPDAWDQAEGWKPRGVSTIVDIFRSVEVTGGEDCAASESDLIAVASSSSLESETCRVSRGQEEEVSTPAIATDSGMSSAPLKDVASEGDVPEKAEQPGGEVATKDDRELPRLIPDKEEGTIRDESGLCGSAVQEENAREEEECPLKHSIPGEADDIDSCSDGANGHQDAIDRQCSLDISGLDSPGTSTKIEANISAVSEVRDELTSCQSHTDKQNRASSGESENKTVGFVPSHSAVADSEHEANSPGFFSEEITDGKKDDDTERETESILDSVVLPSSDAGDSNDFSEEKQREATREKQTILPPSADSREEACDATLPGDIPTEIYETDGENAVTMDESQELNEDLSPFNDVADTMDCSARPQQTLPCDGTAVVADASEGSTGDDHYTMDPVASSDEATFQNTPSSETDLDERENQEELGGYVSRRLHAAVSYNLAENQWSHATGEQLHEQDICSDSQILSSSTEESSEKFEGTNVPEDVRTKSVEANRDDAVASGESHEVSHDLHPSCSEAGSTETCDVISQDAASNKGSGYSQSECVDGNMGGGNTYQDCVNVSPQEFSPKEPFADEEGGNSVTGERADCTENESSPCRRENEISDGSQEKQPPSGNISGENGRATLSPERSSDQENPSVQVPICDEIHVDDEGDEPVRMENVETSDALCSTHGEASSSYSQGYREGVTPREASVDEGSGTAEENRSSAYDFDKTPCVPEKVPDNETKETSEFSPREGEDEVDVEGEVNCGETSVVLSSKTGQDNACSVEDSCSNIDEDSSGVEEKCSNTIQDIDVAVDEKYSDTGEDNTGVEEKHCNIDEESNDGEEKYSNTGEESNDGEENYSNIGEDTNAVEEHCSNTVEDHQGAAEEYSNIDESSSSSGDDVCRNTGEDNKDLDEEKCTDADEDNGDDAEEDCRNIGADSNIDEEKCSNTGRKNKGADEEKSSIDEDNSSNTEEDYSSTGEDNSRAVEEECHNADADNNSISGEKYSSTAETNRGNDDEECGNTGEDNSRAVEEECSNTDEDNSRAVEEDNSDLCEEKCSRTDVDKNYVEEKRSTIDVNNCVAEENCNNAETRFISADEGKCTSVCEGSRDANEEESRYANEDNSFVVEECSNAGADKNSVDEEKCNNADGDNGYVGEKSSSAEEDNSGANEDKCTNIGENDSVVEGSSNDEENSSVVAEEGSNTGENSSVVAEEGSNTGENSSVVAEEGSNTGEVISTVVAEEGSNTGENSVVVAEESSSADEEDGVVVAEEGSNTDEEDGVVAKEGSNTVEDSGDVAEEGSNTDENSGDVAEEGSTGEEDGIAAKEDINTGKEDRVAAEESSNTGKEDGVAAEESSNTGEENGIVPEEGINADEAGVVAEEGSNTGEEDSSVAEEGSNTGENSNVVAEEGSNTGREDSIVVAEEGSNTGEEDGVVAKEDSNTGEESGIVGEEGINAGENSVVGAGEDSSAGEEDSSVAEEGSITEEEDGDVVAEEDSNTGENSNVVAEEGTYTGEEDGVIVAEEGSNTEEEDGDVVAEEDSNTGENSNVVPEESSNTGENSDVVAEESSNTGENSNVVAEEGSNTGENSDVVAEEGRNTGEENNGVDAEEGNDPLDCSPCLSNDIREGMRSQDTFPEENAVDGREDETETDSFKHSADVCSIVTKDSSSLDDQKPLCPEDIYGKIEEPCLHSEEPSVDQNNTASKGELEIPVENANKDGIERVHSPVSTKAENIAMLLKVSLKDAVAEDRIANYSKEVVEGTPDEAGPVSETTADGSSYDTEPTPCTGVTNEVLNGATLQGAVCSDRPAAAKDETEAVGTGEGNDERMPSCLGEAYDQHCTVSQRSSGTEMSDDDDDEEEPDKICGTKNEASPENSDARPVEENAVHSFRNDGFVEKLPQGHESVWENTQGELEPRASVPRMETFGTKGEETDTFSSPENESENLSSVDDIDSSMDTTSPGEEVRAEIQEDQGDADKKGDEIMSLSEDKVMNPTDAVRNDIACEPVACEPVDYEGNVLSQDNLLGARLDCDTNVLADDRTKPTSAEHRDQEHSSPDHAHREATVPEPQRSEENMPASCPQCESSEEPLATVDRKAPRTPEETEVAQMADMLKGLSLEEADATADKSTENDTLCEGDFKHSSVPGEVSERVCNPNSEGDAAELPSDHHVNGPKSGKICKNLIEQPPPEVISGVLSNAYPATRSTEESEEEASSKSNLDTASSERATRGEDVSESHALLLHKTLPAHADSMACDVNDTLDASINPGQTCACDDTLKVSAADKSTESKDAADRKVSISDLASSAQSQLDPSSSTACRVVASLGNQTCSDVAPSVVQSTSHGGMPGDASSSLVSSGTLCACPETCPTTQEHWAESFQVARTSNDEDRDRPACGRPARHPSQARGSDKPTKDAASTEQPLPRHGTSQHTSKTTSSRGRLLPSLPLSRRLQEVPCRRRSVPASLPLPQRHGQHPSAVPRQVDVAPRNHQKLHGGPPIPSSAGAAAEPGCSETENPGDVPVAPPLRGDVLWGSGRPGPPFAASSAPVGIPQARRSHRAASAHSLPVPPRAPHPARMGNNAGPAAPWNPAQGPVYVLPHPFQPMDASGAASAADGAAGQVMIPFPGQPLGLVPANVGHVLVPDPSSEAIGASGPSQECLPLYLTPVQSNSSAASASGSEEPLLHPAVYSQLLQQRYWMSGPLDRGARAGSLDRGPPQSRAAPAEPSRARRTQSVGLLAPSRRDGRRSGGAAVRSYVSSCEVSQSSSPAEAVAGSSSSPRPNRNFWGDAVSSGRGQRSLGSPHAAPVLNGGVPCERGREPVCQKRRSLTDGFCARGTYERQDTACRDDVNHDPTARTNGQVGEGHPSRYGSQDGAAKVSDSRSGPARNGHTARSPRSTSRVGDSDGSCSCSPSSSFSRSDTDQRSYQLGGGPLPSNDSQDRGEPSLVRCTSPSRASHTEVLGVTSPRASSSASSDPSSLSTLSSCSCASLSSSRTGTVSSAGRLAADESAGRVPSSSHSGQSQTDGSELRSTEPPPGSRAGGSLSQGEPAPSSSLDLDLHGREAPPTTSSVTGDPDFSEACAHGRLNTSSFPSMNGSVAASGDHPKYFLGEPKMSPVRQGGISCPCSECQFSAEASEKESDDTSNNGVGPSKSKKHGEGGVTDSSGTSKSAQGILQEVPNAETFEMETISRPGPKHDQDLEKTPPLCPRSMPETPSWPSLSSDSSLLSTRNGKDTSCRKRDPLGVCSFNDSSRHSTPETGHPSEQESFVLLGKTSDNSLQEAVSKRSDSALLLNVLDALHNLGDSPCSDPRLQLSQNSSDYLDHAGNTVVPAGHLNQHCAQSQGLRCSQSGDTRNVSAPENTAEYSAPSHGETLESFASSYVLPPVQGFADNGVSISCNASNHGGESSSLASHTENVADAAGSRSASSSKHAVSNGSSTANEPGPMVSDQKRPAPVASASLQSVSSERGNTGLNGPQLETDSDVSQTFSDEILSAVGILFSSSESPQGSTQDPANRSEDPFGISSISTSGDMWSSLSAAFQEQTLNPFISELYQSEEIAFKTQWQCPRLDAQSVPQSTGGAESTGNQMNPSPMVIAHESWPDPVLPASNRLSYQDLGGQGLGEIISCLEAMMHSTGSLQGQLHRQPSFLGDSSSDKFAFEVSTSCSANSTNSAGAVPDNSPHGDSEATRYRQPTATENLPSEDASEERDDFTVRLDAQASCVLSSGPGDIVDGSCLRSTRPHQAESGDVVEDSSLVQVPEVPSSPILESSRRPEPKECVSKKGKVRFIHTQCDNENGRTDAEGDGSSSCQAGPTVSSPTVQAAVSPGQSLQEQSLQQQQQPCQENSATKNSNADETHRVKSQKKQVLEQMLQKRLQEQHGAHSPARERFPSPRNSHTAQQAGWDDGRSPPVPWIASENSPNAPFVSSFVTPDGGTGVDDADSSLQDQDLYPTVSPEESPARKDSPSTIVPTPFLAAGYHQSPRSSLTPVTARTDTPQPAFDLPISKPETSATSTALGNSSGSPNTSGTSGRCLQSEDGQGPSLKPKRSAVLRLRDKLRSLSAPSTSGSAAAVKRPSHHSASSAALRSPSVRRESMAASPCSSFATSDGLIASGDGSLSMAFLDQSPSENSLQSLPANVPSSTGYLPFDPILGMVYVPGHQPSTSGQVQSHPAVLPAYWCPPNARVVFDQASQAYRCAPRQSTGLGMLSGPQQMSACPQTEHWFLPGSDSFQNQGSQTVLNVCVQQVSKDLSPPSPASQAAMCSPPKSQRERGNFRDEEGSQDGGEPGESVSDDRPAALQRISTPRPAGQGSPRGHVTETPAPAPSPGPCLSRSHVTPSLLEALAERLWQRLTSEVGATSKEEGSSLQQLRWPLHNSPDTTRTTGIHPPQTRWRQILSWRAHRSPRSKLARKNKLSPTKRGKARRLSSQMGKQVPAKEKKPDEVAGEAETKLQEDAGRSSHVSREEGIPVETDSAPAVPDSEPCKSASSLTRPGPAKRASFPRLQEWRLRVERAMSGRSRSVSKPQESTPAASLPLLDPVKSRLEVPDAASARTVPRAETARETCSQNTPVHAVQRTTSLVSEKIRVKEESKRTSEREDLSRVAEEDMSETSGIQSRSKAFTAKAVQCELGSDLVTTASKTVSSTSDIRHSVPKVYDVRDMHVAHVPPRRLQSNQRRVPHKAQFKPKELETAKTENNTPPLSELRRVPELRSPVESADQHHSRLSVSSLSRTTGPPARPARRTESRDYVFLSSSGKVSPARSECSSRIYESLPSSSQSPSGTPAKPRIAAQLLQKTEASRSRKLHPQGAVQSWSPLQTSSPKEPESPKVYTYLPLTGKVIPKKTSSQVSSSVNGSPSASSQRAPRANRRCEKRRQSDASKDACDVWLEKCRSTPLTGEREPEVRKFHRGMPGGREPEVRKFHRGMPGEREPEVRKFHRGMPGEREPEVRKFHRGMPGDWEPEVRKFDRGMPGEREPEVRKFHRGMPGEREPEVRKFHRGMPGEREPEVRKFHRGMPGFPRSETVGGRRQDLGTLPRGESPPGDTHARQASRPSRQGSSPCGPLDSRSQRFKGQRWGRDGDPGILSEGQTRRAPQQGHVRHVEEPVAQRPLRVRCRDFFDARSESPDCEPWVPVVPTEGRRRTQTLDRPPRRLRDARSVQRGREHPLRMTGNGQDGQAAMEESSGSFESWVEWRSSQGTCDPGSPRRVTPSDSTLPSAVKCPPRRSWPDTDMRWYSFSSEDEGGVGPGLGRWVHGGCGQDLAYRRHSVRELRRLFDSESDSTGRSEHVASAGKVCPLDCLGEVLSVQDTRDVSLARQPPPRPPPPVRVPPPPPAPSFQGPRPSFQGLRPSIQEPSSSFQGLIPPRPKQPRITVVVTRRRTLWQRVKDWAVQKQSQLLSKLS